MKKTQEARLTEMTKVAAFKITNALKAFEKEPIEIQQQADQMIMQRVQRMRNGDNHVIDGTNLIKEIPDEG